MNMFKPVAAKTNREYFDSLPEDRRNHMETVDAFIRKTAPALTPHFAYNMPGYGSFKYVNYKKEVLDWPVISLANQKHYMSLYVCALDNGEYVAEKYKKELGKVSVGKSCIRFKESGDLNFSTLGAIIRFAEKHPGLTPDRG